MSALGRRLDRTPWPAPPARRERPTPTEPVRRRPRGTRRARLLRPLAFSSFAAALVAAVSSAGAGAAAGAAANPGLATYVAVSAGDLSAQAVTRNVDALGGHVVAQLPVAGAAVVELPIGSVAPAGMVLLPDTSMRLDDATLDGAGPLDSVRQTVGLPAGVDGRGVKVAVVDTGVYDSPDLAGRVIHLNASGDPAGDGYGHGTFMAGIIAGDGSSSGGEYAGVAPAADLVDVKVATADGTTSLSRVLVGLQMVAAFHAKDPSLRVVNLSLSSGVSLPAQFDPLARALDTLWHSGVTVVVAAGNSGPAAGTVTSPGDDPTVLTVGALDDHQTADRSDDTVADFSSRGPTAAGDDKPDLVAPGMHIVSLRDPGSVIDSEYATARVGDDYFVGTGTSMSTAVVSGVVADLASVRPNLSPDDVKALLTGTAYGAPGLGDQDVAGSGGVDLGAALVARVGAAHGVGARFGANAGFGRGATGTADTVGGPTERDAAAWSRFAAAWQSGNYRATARAWSSLSAQSRAWAARAWAMTLWAQGALSDNQTMLARAWSARAWVGASWLARAWAARAWVSDDWAARAWSARAWSARAWSEADWTARAWVVSSWANDSWSARAWVGDTWGG